MRPLLHPRLSQFVAQQASTGAALLHAFGPFCAISERPLPDQILVWNVPHRQNLDETLPSEAHFSESLALSPEFEDVTEAADEASLLLPHQMLKDPSRFNELIYALQEVSVEFFDQDAQDLGTPSVTETQELVIVTGTTKPAENLVTQFSLNSRGYDAETNTLKMSQANRARMSHNLVFQRTLAWHRIEEIAQLLKPIDDPDHMLVAQARMLANAIGFWSCWVTVLRNNDISARITRAILGGSETAKPRLKAAAEDTLDGPSSDNSFPGTDPSIFDIITP